MTGFELRRVGFGPLAALSQLRIGRGAPPWAPAFEPKPDGEPYRAGIACHACGMPHAHVSCDQCGHGHDLRLICDYCAEWQPFDVVGLVQLNGRRLLAAMAVSFAVGLMAGKVTRRWR